MNDILAKYFEEWLAEKEKYNLIKEIYGITGLMAVVNFIEYIKYRESFKYNYMEALNGKFNGSSSRRNQTNYA